MITFMRRYRKGLQVALLAKLDDFQISPFDAVGFIRRL